MSLSLQMGDYNKSYDSVTSGNCSRFLDTTGSDDACICFLREYSQTNCSVIFEDVNFKTIVLKRGKKEGNTMSTSPSASAIQKKKKKKDDCPQHIL